MTASAPCLAGVLSISICLLFTVWVTPENQLAELALHGSSVLTQDFRGPQMGGSRSQATRPNGVHKPTDRQPACAAPECPAASRSADCLSDRHSGGLRLHRPDECGSGRRLAGQ